MQVEWVAMRGQVLAQVLPREVVSEAKPSVPIGLVELVLQVILPAQMGMGVTVENLHITTLVGLAVEQADTAEEAVMALTVTVIQELTVAAEAAEAAVGQIRQIVAAVAV